MGVEEFIASYKAGKIEQDTLMHYVYKAALAIDETLMGEDGELHKEKLKGKEGQKAREGAARKFYETLEQVTMEYFGINPEQLQDSRKREHLVYGFFSIPREFALDYLKRAEDQYTLASVIQTITREGGLFDYQMGKRLRQDPQSKLDEKDAQKVVEKTKTAGRVDPKKLGLAEMAELLTEFVDKGGNEHAIADAFLKGKRYAIIEEELKQAA